MMSEGPDELSAPPMSAAAARPRRPASVRIPLEKWPSSSEEMLRRFLDAMVIGVAAPDFLWFGCRLLCVFCCWFCWLLCSVWKGAFRG